jgi:hypothetical protein
MFTSQLQLTDSSFRESWLARQNHKKARRTCICWVFWLGFFAFVAGVVIVVLWLKASGVLDKIKFGPEEQQAGATPTPTPTNKASSTTDSRVRFLL